MLAVGAVGDDLLGDMVAAAMARHGVDTSGLSRKSGVQTSATILPIRGNGERPALHVPGATALLELADVNLDRVRGSRALLVGAPDALGGIVGDGLAQVAAAARAGGALVAVDVLHPGRPRDLERIAGLLAMADWFLPNDDQLLALTGRDDLTSAIEDVLALGTGGVAVTCGADGCWSPGGRRRPRPLPAIKVDVVDTTGCGDGFTAGMLAGLLLGCRPGRRGLARRRLRLAGRDRPRVGRRDREPRPGAGLPAAARSRPWPTGSPPRPRGGQPADEGANP